MSAASALQLREIVLATSGKTVVIDEIQKLPILLDEVLVLPWAIFLKRLWAGEIIS